MTEQRQTRICVVLGALALLPFAAGKAWTQDVFASNGGDSGSSTPVYQDSYSSKCEQTSHLVTGGYNPAYCFQLTLTGNSGSKCPAIGGEDSTLAGQSGNTCYYCQDAGQLMEQAVPGGHWIVVPSDSGGAAYAAYQQGYECSANPADNCYLSCFGKDSFKPPSGTTLMAGTGTGGTPQPSGSGNQPPIKLQGYVSTAPDPCFPAGPKNYNVCDYPNLTRPPGCTCSQTPAPKPTAKATPQPAKPTPSQPPDEGNYLSGVVDGIGSCIQSIPANLLSLLAGAGYFAQGDFIHAAQMWGVQPGQSMYLKSIYTEMTTPQVGVVNSVSDYQRGVAGGKRLCKYLLIPAAKQAVKSTLKGGVGTSGSSPPQIASSSGKPPQLSGSSGGATPKLSGGTSKPGGNPPSQLPASTGSTPKLPTVASGPAPGVPSFGNIGGLFPLGPASGGNGVPAVPSSGGVPAPVNGGSPAGDPDDFPPTLPPQPGTAVATPGGGDGTSEQTPMWGGALQDELNGDPKKYPNLPNPANLGDKWIKLQKGPVQLGPYVAHGSFADVFKFNGKMIKVSRNGPQTGGYGPASIAGQLEGAQRLQGTGVKFPSVDASSFQPGDANTPASLEVGDAEQEYPGYKPISPADFQKMPPTEQQAVLKATNDLTNTAAKHGLVIVDTNNGNIWYKKDDNGNYDAMLIDTDMVMTVPEIDQALDAYYASNNSTTPGSVPAGVLAGGLVEGNNTSLMSNPSATAQQFTDVLNDARENQFMKPVSAEPAAPAANEGDTIPQ